MNVTRGGNAVTPQSIVPDPPKKKKKKKKKKKTKTNRKAGELYTPRALFPLEVLGRINRRGKKKGRGGRELNSIGLFRDQRSKRS